MTMQKYNGLLKKDLNQSKDGIGCTDRFKGHHIISALAHLAILEESTQAEEILYKDPPNTYQVMPPSCGQPSDPRGQKRAAQSPMD